MKSSVTNDVLPILPIRLEIYFSGLQNDISRFFFSSFYLPKNEKWRRPHIPESHGSQISLWTVSCCCALFSHDFKGKPQKSKFKSSLCRNRNKLKSLTLAVLRKFSEVNSNFGSLLMKEKEKFFLQLIPFNFTALIHNLTLNFSLELKYLFCIFLA